ncbi:MAG: pyrroline-5-carboxylate reductase [Xanthomonadales bacterium]|nr:pyrroline-5-carboxylate reductase [Xanthomonadales bacterium]
MTLAFVGGGNMARALIGGLLQRGVASARIRVSEPQQAARAALAADFGVMVTADNEAALRGADCLILAVKPQVMRGVCEGLRAALPSHTIVVSIAAGIRVDQLSAWLGGHDRIVRCMPNTPALLRAGATGLFASGGCSETDRTRADTLLSAVGTTAWIADEALMDAVTALSGSGPAYVFLLAEAMTEAAQALGLPRDTARTLADQTLLGAARMLVESDEDAATLRARVTSPGGTTQAAVETFEAGGFRELVRRAVDAAARRGAELSASAGD